MFHPVTKVNVSFLFIIVLISSDMVCDESGTTRASCRLRTGNGVAAAASLGGRKRKSGDGGKASGKKRRTADHGRHNN